jgi:hypothetical protein
VRDPLLTLGCADPVVRLSTIKANDPFRQRAAEILETWHRHHGSKPVPVAELAEEVRAVVDPQDRGRQFIQSEIRRLVGTRLHGLVLTCQKPASRWGKATYAVDQVDTAEPTSGTL